MTALRIVQDICSMHALNVPQSLVSSPDTQTSQFLALMNEAIDEIILESKYNAVTLECVHTLTPGQDQGPMESLGGGLSGYYQANFETFFDRTLRHPLYGPLSDTEWQEIMALPNPGPFYKFRIRQDHFLIAPTPTAPFSVIAFEYMSTFGVQAADGTAKETVTLDSDTFAIPERIVKKWTMFRWKQIKGLPYEEDQGRAFDMLENYIARDKVKTRVNLANPDQITVKPGVFVPSGNWPVS